MTKTNQYYYDKLRDCYNLVCENEEKRKPAAPIKKKKPTFEKSAFIKYGSGYADQGGGGSKIRTTYKDFDEAADQPKRKTLKEFLADAGESTTTPIKINKKNRDLLYQYFLAAQRFDDFDDFVGFVKHIS